MKGIATYAFEIVGLPFCDENAGRITSSRITSPFHKVGLRYVVGQPNPCVALLPTVVRMSYFLSCAQYGVF
jgi:hypothetical protein